MRVFLPSPVCVAGVAGTEPSIPVVTSGDFDEILYADTNLKRCALLTLVCACPTYALQAWSIPSFLGRLVTEHDPHVGVALFPT
jgi:hypothetical protein